MNWSTQLRSQQIFPVKTLQDQQKKIDLYIAKNWEESEFRHALLTKIVQEARKSYWVSYGRTIPLIDKYDRKSSVFFTITTFADDVSKREFEEILSIRFTPILGDPIGNYDVDLYHLSSQPQKKMIEELQKVFSLSKLSTNHFYQHMFSISRLCAVRPHAVRNGKKFNKNNFTAESFAMMTKYFVESFWQEHSDFLCLTTQMQSKMEEKLRMQPYVNKRLRSVQSLFSHEEYGHVVINRLDHEKYVYQYPGYFLDVEQLTRELNMLINEGKLTIDQVSLYIDSQRDWEVVLQDPHYLDYRKFGDLLVKDGQINKYFSHSDLRQHLNETVNDGSQLYIMKFDHNTNIMEMS